MLEQSANTINHLFAIAGTGADSMITIGILAVAGIVIYATTGKVLGWACKLSKK